mgnify:CR=1 FL=1
MRNIPKKIWSAIVGGSYGYAEEGSEQWYYTAALAMCCMLAWSFLPEIAMAFTILSVIHLGMVFMYGINDLLVMSTRQYAFEYLAVSFALFCLALLLNWWWALITAVFVTIVMAFAPDCTSESFFTTRVLKFDCNKQREGCEKTSLICNTFFFALFVIVTCLLPTAWWVKLLVVVVSMGLHVLLDYFEADNVNAYEISCSAFCIAFYGTPEEQLQKYIEEQSKGNEENQEEG